MTRQEIEEKHQVKCEKSTNFYEGNQDFWKVTDTLTDEELARCATLDDAAEILNVIRENK